MANELLERIPLKELAAALGELPDAASHPASTVSCPFTSATVGDVVITFRRRHIEADNQVVIFWAADSARYAAR